MSIMNKWLSSLFLLLILAPIGAQSQVNLEEEITAKSYIVTDFETGRVLIERDSDLIYPPASMTKLMTLFLAYDGIAEGIIAKDQMIRITSVGSSFSRPSGSSLMRLEEGQVVTVLDLMKGLAVMSGNDAAYAIADLLGPGVGPFVRKMNDKARELGLDHTSFVDPDGWSELNNVTANEYAQLARAYIMAYPEALEELHSVPFMVYPLPANMPEGIDFQIQVPRTKKNTNILLDRVEGMDGLKTGYIDESGFNFTGTAERDGQRIITVNMGIFTDSYYQGILQRANESEILIEYAFEEFASKELPLPSIPSQKVWKGSVNEVMPALNELPSALVSDMELSQVDVNYEIDPLLIAPLAVGTVIGNISYTLDGIEIEKIDLIIADKIDEANWFIRLIHSIRLLFI